MLRPQIIHSGHFMVSEPHADRGAAAGGTEDDDDDDDEVVESPPVESVMVLSERVLADLGPEAAIAWRGKRGPGEYDFDTVNERTCQTYRYGPRNCGGCLSIDASLTKLFECMTLAYSGKIVSPKWKTFKGLKLLQRDKIRLNNAIWRAWYLQYVEKQKNPVCNFVTPLEGNDVDNRRKPEAVVMEGKYWKRHSEIVIREYHKWRTFVRTRLRQKKDRLVSSSTQSKSDNLSWQDLEDSASADSPMDLDPLHDFNALIAELTDTLFSTRNPYGGPNPRGYAFLGNADMIQPSLSQLHPNLGEDFMDTLEPLQDFFTPPSWALQGTGSSATQTSIIYQPAPFFSVITQTVAPEASLPRDALALEEGPHTPGTFAVPISSPPVRTGSSRRKPLQRIAPRSTATMVGNNMAPANAFMAHLVITATKSC